MNNTVKAIIGLCFVVGLFGNACSGKSSEASETGKETEVAQSNADAGDHDGHDHAAGDGHDHGGTGSEAAMAYDAVMSEIRSAQQTIRDQRQLVTTVETLFLDFIEKYPGTEQAADAQLNLGQIYSQLNRTDDAIAILYEMIDSGTASNEKVGIAHYLLGDAYKASDQFDKARREYQMVLDDYAFLGGQILGMARSNLDDLEVLSKLAIGSKPIPFEVTGTEGEKLSLDKYKGKVVLLDFWATWCGPCRVEMPNVVKLYKEHHNKGFEIIGVSLDRSRRAFDQYVEANDMDWPQYFDGKYWQNDIAMKYRVRYIPATFLIDRQGVLRYRSLRGRELEEAVTQLLKEPS